MLESRLDSMFRSLLSVVAGIVVLTIAAFAIEAAVNPLLLWAFPRALPTPESLLSNPWAKAMTFSYGFLCVAAGGYVTAKLAPRRPLRHTAALGITQAALTLAAMVSPEGRRASQLQWIAIAVLSIPSALAGGWLYVRRNSGS